MHSRNQRKNPYSITQSATIKYSSWTDGQNTLTHQSGTDLYRCTEHNNSVSEYCFWLFRECPEMWVIAADVFFISKVSRNMGYRCTEHVAARPTLIGLSLQHDALSVPRSSQSGTVDPPRHRAATCSIPQQPAESVYKRPLLYHPRCFYPRNDRSHPSYQTTLLQQPVPASP